MKNKNKCTHCGLVNFETINVCKRCGNYLPNNPDESVEKLDFGFPTFAVNGCGISLIDYVKTDSNAYEVMKWATLITIPIIPLSAWIVVPTKYESSIPGVYEVFRFGVLKKTDLKLGRIFRIYAINIIALFPLILIFSLIDKLGSLIFISGIFLSIGWLFLLLWRFSDNGMSKYSNA